MLSDITWRQKYLPGTTDNFGSNEAYTTGITAQQVWPYLSDISKWESCYDNASRITAPRSGPRLAEGDVFWFSTFGFPPIRSEVRESAAPAGPGRPRRVAWRSWQEGGGDEDADADADAALDIYHAWVVEGVAWGAVRILTQESQIGKPAARLAATRPNRMLNGHQDWLDGLVKITRENAE
ncbi:hypothetical protein F4802DRAFT_599406 [Xylaria palmicola]|nr:hypothetical protein F4802DRAFT_599406 [Xylaria palmicola]